MYRRRKEVCSVIDYFLSLLKSFSSGESKSQYAPLGKAGGRQPGGKYCQHSIGEEKCFI